MQAETYGAIRVLHIVGQLSVGGAEMQLLGLCRRFDRERIIPSVISYTLSDDSLAPAFREHGVEVDEFDKYSMPVWRFFLELRSRIKRMKPTVVHTWLYSANFWGRWAAATCGVQSIIASERGQFVLTGTLPRITDKLLKRRTTWVVNAEVISRALKKQYGVTSARTKIIRNAVHLPPVDRAECRRNIRKQLSIDSDQYIVLMVGRRTWEKNYPMFMRAAGLVSAERHDTTFVVVGRSTDDGALERTLRGMNDNGQVRFVGQKDDVERWYAAADVFCLTSQSEGMPNVVLEAMWSKLPVVCAAFGSVREVIPNDRVGIVVPQDDSQKLASTVMGLINDPQRRVAMGEAARDHVDQHHSWESMVTSFESVYHRCLQNR